MNKKVLVLTFTLLIVVMLATPLVGSVQARGWWRTQRIEDDLIIRKAIWLSKTWDPIEIGPFTFTHTTVGGRLMVVDSPLGVLGDALPILENPGSDVLPPYLGPLSWRNDQYDVSFTGCDGKEVTYMLWKHSTYCFTNGNLKVTIGKEDLSAPDGYDPATDGVWIYGRSLKGYGTNGLDGVVV